MSKGSKDALRRDCPACQPSARPAIFWSKAGMTSQLCDEHKKEARRYRRAYS